MEAENFAESFKNLEGFCSRVVLSEFGIVVGKFLEKFKTISQSHCSDNFCLEYVFMTVILIFRIISRQYCP